MMLRHFARECFHFSPRYEMWTNLESNVQVVRGSILILMNYRDSGSWCRVQFQIVPRIHFVSAEGIHVSCQVQQVWYYHLWRLILQFPRTFAALSNLAALGHEC